MFGSRAKETYKQGSDIDIALTGDQLNLCDIAALHDKFDDLEYIIDLIIYNNIQEQEFKNHIDRVEIEIFNRSKK